MYESLGDADRQLFEKNFLASPSHQEKLEISRAFMALSKKDNQAVPEPKKTYAPRPSFASRRPPAFAQFQVEQRQRANAGH
jgi:hypothetical protein